jgi:GT2 family glycosyltransferase
MKIDVVIVNYRSEEVLSRCLAALREQTISHSIQIIDNASDDGSPRRIYDEYPEVAMLPLRRNVGFARAVNIAAQRSQSDVLVTLNPDTVPTPAFIEEITAPFAIRPELGSVAGTLLFESHPDIIASAGIDVHRNGVAIDALLGEKHDSHAPLAPVFGASAGAAAFRRDAFIRVGGLAEPFFMYLEDVDLAWRMRMQGFSCVWNPAASVLHRYSSSAVEGSSFKRRLLARNRIWTLVRCLPDEILKRDWPHICAFDGAALAYGVATLDRASLIGRAHSVAGILPRLSERRRIQEARSVEVDAIDRWIQSPISARRLLELRRLTGRFAA